MAAKSRRAAKKSPAKRPAKKAARKKAPTRTPIENLNGWITHTELNSADPAATKEFCAKTFGWKFKPPFPTPSGDYHLYAYSDKGGGGIRVNGAGETSGCTPFVKVRDAKAAFEKALSHGAEEMFPPTFVMEGVTIAIVKAPGGVPIGLSGP